MRINLISHDNGVGLTRDVELLGQFLRAQGHAASFVSWKATAPKADLNIYLELFDPRHFETAKRHVGIFNLEWFRPAWREHLHVFDQLWAKSAEAFEWYMEHGYDQAAYTGFLSRDMFDPTVTKTSRVLHVRGKSGNKGTHALIEAYKRHADLPPLTIVAFTAIQDAATRVDQWLGVSDLKLRELMNAHAIHACPSEVEGWGHYIAEAVSCKAIVVTTDASPMSDHVLPTFGRLISPNRSQAAEFYTRYFCDPDAIAEGIRWAAKLSDFKLTGMRAHARAWHQTRQRAFQDIASDLLRRL